MDRHGRSLSRGATFMLLGMAIGIVGLIAAQIIPPGELDCSVSLVYGEDCFADAPTIYGSIALLVLGATALLVSRSERGLTQTWASLLATAMAVSFAVSLLLLRGAVFLDTLQV